MVLGVDIAIWKILLIVLLLPVVVVGTLNVLLRKRGGIGPGWGGVLVIFLAGVMALLVILEKIHL